MKTGESSDEKTLGEKLDEKMKYPKKLLDGRTETFYSMLFIEIPQGLILLGYENACVSSCNVTNKNMKKGITAAVNGGMALFSNAFRFLTCSTLCEETVVDEENEKSKFVACLRSIFKCCCPCLCCFHRYVYDLLKTKNLNHFKVHVYIVMYTSLTFIWRLTDKTRIISS